MFKVIDSILDGFRPCFSREKTFLWFTIAVFGLIVRLDTHGVTSFIRSLALDPASYVCILHFFYSSAWQLTDITKCWINIILAHCQPISIDGHFLMIGDGIKVSKEAKRMPGVKKLHQESDDSSKPEYIFGHHFGVISLLIGTIDIMENSSLSQSLPNSMKASPNFANSKARNPQRSTGRKVSASLP